MEDPFAERELDAGLTDIAERGAWALLNPTSQVDQLRYGSVHHSTFP